MLNKLNFEERKCTPFIVTVVQVLFGITQGDSKTCCLYLPDLDTVNP